MFILKLKSQIIIKLDFNIIRNNPTINENFFLIAPSLVIEKESEKIFSSRIDLF